MTISDQITDSSKDAITYYLHQDKLMWSRLQTMQAIQLATLGGCYTLRPVTWLSLSILLIGVILTLLVFFLFKRDQLIRDEIGKHLKPVSYPTSKWFAPRGRLIAFIILAILLIADMVLGVSVYLKILDG